MRWLIGIVGFAVLMWGAIITHTRAVRDVRETAYAEGVEDTKAAAEAGRREAERRSAAINAPIRSKSDEEAGRIYAGADELRVRGPGRSAYPGCPATPAAASEHGAADWPADAAVAGMPADAGLAVVPWDQLVAFAREHDLNRGEALAWRESDQKQREAQQRPE